MGFQKYQKVEKVQIEAQDESERIREGVNKLGKTSASELTEDQKRSVLDK